MIKSLDVLESKLKLPLQNWMILLQDLHLLSKLFVSYFLNEAVYCTQVNFFIPLIILDTFLNQLAKLIVECLQDIGSLILSQFSHLYLLESIGIVNLFLVPFLSPFETLVIPV